MQPWSSRPSLFRRDGTRKSLQENIHVLFHIYNSSIPSMIISVFSISSSLTSSFTVPAENLTTSLSRVDVFTRTISPVSLNLGILRILTFCPSSPIVSRIYSRGYRELSQTHTQADFQQRICEESPPAETDHDPEMDNTLQSTLTSSKKIYIACLELWGRNVAISTYSPSILFVHPQYDHRPHTDRHHLSLVRCFQRP